MNKKAFTLAEILIVLVLIGVLTAILLPVAFHAAPDEDVMKFKKGYNTLGTVIRELVTSDKYFKDGDLGTKSDGSQADASTGANKKYFCSAFADVVNAKKINCTEENIWIDNGVLLNGKSVSQSYTPLNPTDETIKAAKEKLDTNCKNAQSKMPEEIILNDGTVFYQTTTSNQFGTWAISNSDGSVITNPDGTIYSLRYFSSPNQFPANYADESGFDIAYKVFCMDIDGFNKGEDPFGFGIRADGKMITGARADEWIEKSIQKGNE